MVAACAPHSTVMGAFAVTYPDAAALRMKIGGHVYAKPSARCTRDDGSEARWAISGAHVVSGGLPPGVTIEDGTITGAPTQAGEFGAQLAITGVTCASKSYADQTVDVRITVVGR
jgi:hypothetical protein